MAKCHGMNKKGHPCGFPAKEGELYCRYHRPNEAGDPLEVYRRLAEATPKERTEIVLKLIEEHPDGRLELPDSESIYANLKGADLRAANLKGADLRGANLQGADLRGVNLQETDLGGARLHEADVERANLQGANLERVNFQKAILLRANLQEANLCGANLQKANIGNANLQEANLIAANLQNASLMHANLQETHLWAANLQEANLWGANIQKADLRDVNLQIANLERVNFQKAILLRANLQEANLEGTDFQKTNLTYANLQKAHLAAANLQEANLRGAKLQGVDLLDCESLANIYLANAWLDKTRLRHSQLGRAIGEEISGDYTAAKNGYLILKQNFDDLGDYEGSSWAYLKERRMEKLEARQKAIEALTERSWRDFATCGGKFLGDQLIEIVSNYGEGFWRVVFWIVAFIFVIGPLFFWGFGSFEWSEQVTDIYFDHPYRWQQHWYTYRQILLYTIDTFTTANFAEIKPSDDFTRLTSGCMAIWGIFLVGLLGFVAGNRIRRS